MTMGLRFPLLALAGGLVAVLGCQRPAELRVPLDYRPTDHLDVVGFTAPGTLRLAVTVTDARTETPAIGRNVEDHPPVPIYPTDPAPDVFVRDAVARELGNAGIGVESDPHHATKTLHLRLQHFWVEEHDTYQGNIVADAQLADASGHRLWGSQVSGNAERFGRSLSAENYQETLSDSVVNLVSRLLHTESFLGALRSQPTGSRRR